MVGIGITAPQTSWLPLRNPTQLVGCGMNAWFGGGQVRDEPVLVVRNATSDRRLEIKGRQIEGCESDLGTRTGWLPTARDGLTRDDQDVSSDPTMANGRVVEHFCGARIRCRHRAAA